jgi:hypothetical protein
MIDGMKGTNTRLNSQKWFARNVVYIVGILNLLYIYGTLKC